MTSFENKTICENVEISECMDEKCSHSVMPVSHLLSDHPPSSYDNVSVAAENEVGVGAAKTCTTQPISELSLFLLYLYLSIHWYSSRTATF